MIKKQYLLKLGVVIIATNSLYADPLNIEALVPSDDYFRLDPTLHLRAAHGETTIGDDSVAFGGHDPDEDGFNFQGFEVGASFFIGENVSGFTTLNVFKNDGEDFESEFEEGFLKLSNLPGGFELRGGRMLARFGDQNAKHSPWLGFCRCSDRKCSLPRRRWSCL